MSRSCSWCVGGDAGATNGFLDRVLVKGVEYEKRPQARGNAFRLLMTRLGGVTVNYDRVTSRTPEQRRQPLRDTQRTFAMLA